MDAPDRHNGRNDKRTCLFVRLSLIWSSTHTIWRLYGKTASNAKINISNGLCVFYSFIHIQSYSFIKAVDISNWIRTVTVNCEKIR